MIRSDLLKALAKQNSDLHAEEIELIAEVFFDEIAECLAAGGRVDLRGFATFSTRERGPRRGRNPRTGEAVDVPAKRAAHFKPGKLLRARVNTR